MPSNVSILTVKSIQTVPTLQPSEFTTHVLSAFERGADGGDQFLARGVFQDVSQRACLQACLDEHRFRMHRHEHDPGVRVVAPDQGDRLDTVDTRHGNIGDDHVRCEPLGRLQQSITILDRRNDVEVRSE